MNIAKNIESSSIVVQWDEVDDSLPTTYTVTWTSERDLNNVQVKNLEEQSLYTITGLTLGTVYTITVTADNRCGTGPELYSTSVSLTTNTTFTSTSTITAITNTITITSAASSSTSTAIAKSSSITITASIAMMNPSTTTTNPITTSNITSTYTATDIMSPASTMNLIDTSTDDKNSKILSISIYN